MSRRRFLTGHGLEAQGKLLVRPNQRPLGTVIGTLPELLHESPLAG